MFVNPELEGGPFYWQAGSTGILLVHGFTATTAEVRPLARHLHSNGYTVAGPLLPGHGTHPGDLNRVRWQTWADCCEETYDRLGRSCERVVIGGESMGGVLALLIGERHPEIEALLLYAPALRLNRKPGDLVRMRLLAPFVPWIRKPKPNANPLWQGYPVNPLKGALQLVELQKVVVRRLSAVRQPVLVIQGRLDPTVHPSIPDLVFERVRSTIKEKYWLDQSAHCVVLDCEIEQVVAFTTRFLTRLLK